MNSKIINTLISVLKYKKRVDLAELLENSDGEIEETGTYGSYAFSIISTFLIFSPVEEYYKLKQLCREDLGLILESIQEIIPPADNSPEIKYLDFRISLRENNEEKLREKDYYLGEKIRVFLCYSTTDKILAGEIKNKLEGVGFEVFLAHEDIVPATEWREVIIQNLKSTDIFIPIITENFKNSDWADQECGIAFTNNKFIIPIGIDGKIPYGFLDKYQVLSARSELVDWSFPEIVKTVQKEKRFANSLLNSLIKGFENSNNWHEAGEKSELFLIFDEINQDQMDEIIRATTQNDQINCSFAARSNLKLLFKKYSHLINKKILIGVDEAILELIEK